MSKRQPLRNGVGVVAVLAAAACGSTGPPAAPTSTMSSLTIEGPPIVDRGQTVTFRAVLRVQPDPVGESRDVSQEARWSTNNAAVLSINKGVATGHQDGIALLEATLADGSRAARPVTVGSYPTVLLPEIAPGQTVSGSVGALQPQPYRLRASSSGTLVARLGWTDPFNDSALSLKVDATEYGRPGGPSPLTVRVPVQAGVEYTLIVTMLYAESQVNVDYTLATAIE